MSILSVKNISKSFGKLDVLNDISFNVEQGEVISIIGPSGSGKSTLLRCINQFEKIDSGECEICGITMTKNDENGKAVYADNKTLHDIRLKIGLVFQNFNLFPQYTALQNITLAGELLAKEKPEYKANRKAIHAELEEKAKAGGQISLAEYAEALKTDKGRGKPAKQEKPSIRAQLKAAKEQTPKKQAKQKTQDLERS